ncbi:MAG: N-acetylmuramoyl-L-alanine amidase [Candidatus Paceibacterota bacterium]|jgi:N-acetyl-anhydromuramyl-L-alanine amidase AmpD
MFSLNRYSLGLFNDSKAYASYQMDSEAVAYAELDLNTIIQVDFPEDQYFKQQTTKKQIVLHHTVSGQGVDGDISWWRQTADRVGTAIIVGWDGKIYQCFSTLYWAHHLGTHAANNGVLNMGSIGIEIDAWGALIEVGGKWYPATWDANLKKNIPNITVKPIQNVELYPAGFKGFYGFEKYTDAQIEAVRKLLVFWNKKYNIPLTYNQDMWALSNKALSGQTGVWTHVSFREDKSDCHPAPNLIQMLKSLA